MAKIRLALIGSLFLALSSHSVAATSSALFARGYTVIPSPQKVTLGPHDFEFSSGWRLELGSGMKPGDIAVESLNESLAERFHLTLNPRQRRLASSVWPLLPTRSPSEKSPIATIPPSPDKPTVFT